MDKDTLHLAMDVVDDPIPIAFWDPPEFIVACMLLGMGVIFNPVIGFLGAGLVLKYAKVLKQGNKRGAVQHWLWRAGMPIDASFTGRMPPPWEYCPPPMSAGPRPPRRTSAP